MFSMCMYLQICWWTLPTTAICEPTRWLRSRTTGRTVTGTTRGRCRRLVQGSFTTELIALADAIARWTVAIVCARAIHTRSVVLIIPLALLRATHVQRTCIVRYAYMVWLVVCPKHVIFASRRLSESSRFWALRLPLAYAALLCKGIR